MEIKKRLIQNNFTKGRFGYKIKRIVMHTYDGGGTTLYNWFNRPTTRASAHYSVWYDGTVEQYVLDKDMAWHGGTVAGNGKPNNNWESLGIEHMDLDKPQDSKRTKELYESSAQLVAHLCKKHNIPCKLLPESQKWGNGITLHRYYANKSCPGGLDVAKIVKRANEILKPTPKPDPTPEWKKGWTRQVEQFSPKQKYKLYNINTKKVVKSYEAEGKKVGTMYKKGDWRMTEYSYKNNKPNAFLVGELTWKPESKPDPEPEHKKTYLIGYNPLGDDKAKGFGGNEDLAKAKVMFQEAVKRVAVLVKEEQRDYEVELMEADAITGKILETIDKEIVEYEPELEAHEYVLVYTPAEGKIQRQVFWDEQLALNRYYQLENEIIAGDVIELFDNDILIHSFKKEMENAPVDHKTVGDHLKSTVEIAVPVQAVTTFVGVIFGYYNPDMPIEVILAFSGLFGIAFNVIYIVAQKLLNKLD